MVRSTTLIDAAEAVALERWEVPALDGTWASSRRHAANFSAQSKPSEPGAWSEQSNDHGALNPEQNSAAPADTSDTASAGQAQVSPDPAELEAIRAAAFDEAYANGFDQGTQDAAKIVEALQALAGPLRDLQQDAEQRVSHACLQLAIEIARRMVGESLQSNPESVLAAVHQVIQAAGHDATEGHLLLHPSQIAIVQQHESEIALPAGLQLRADPTLQPGDCRWQSAYAEIDGRVLTRWRAALAALGVPTAKQDPGPETERSPEAGDPADADL